MAAPGARVARARGLDPDAILDLSATLNPLAPDVVALVRDLAGELLRYPDPEDLRAATVVLAAAIGVDADRLVLTNGGAEAIALVAGLHPEGTIEEPEFSLYRRHLARVIADGPVWRSNPNNPTGVLADAGATAAVWDEAFYPVTTGEWTRGDDAAWRLGSLTKLWSCPGLRLGYVIAPTVAHADRLRRAQPAWAVNSLALAAVAPLLDQTDLRGWATRLAGLRADLETLVRGAGFDVHAGAAPWILVEGAAALDEQLARHGIVTRDCTSFGLPGTVRVAVPDEHGLARIAAVLSS